MRRHRHRHSIACVLVLAALSWGHPLAHAQFFGLGKDDDTDLVAGKAAVEDAFYDLGRKRLESYIEQTSDKSGRAVAIAYLARAMVGQEQYQEALDLLDLRQGWARKNAHEAAFRFWRARARWGLGELRRVDALLQTFAADHGKDPHVPPALLLRARALHGSGEYQAAIDVHRQLAETHPDAAEAPDNLLEWGELQAECGLEDEAGDRWRELIRLYPESSQAEKARYEVAMFYIESHQWEAALELLNPLTSETVLDPRVRVWAHLAIADIEYRRERPAAAMQSLAWVMENGDIAGDRARAGAMRGRILLDENKSEEGITLLQQAIPDLPDSAEAARTQFFLAQTLQALGKHERAVEAFQNYQEAFAEQPNRVGVAMGKGWSLWELGQYAEAAGGFDKVHALADADEQRAEAILKAADAYFADKQYAPAMERYRDFVAAFPGNGNVEQAWSQIAEALARSGDPAGAQLALDKMVARDPSSSRARNATLRKGLLHEEVGEWPEAEEVYVGLITQDPETEEATTARLRRGLVCYRMGRFQDALEAFDGVAERTSEGEQAEEAFYMRGWCRYMLGEDQQARELCRSFIERFPESSLAPRVIFWLGEYDWNHGRDQAAEDWFMMLVGDHPQHDLAEKSLFWAARAAARQSEFVRASEHVAELVRMYPQSPLMPQMRLQQGDVLSELGQFSGAILAFDEIIKNWPGSYLVDRAWGRKGDCQFTLGTEGVDAATQSARFSEALTSYTTVYESTTASPELKLQALYKIGRCQEKMGRPDQAEETYLNVIYEHISARQTGNIIDPFWFTRAAFSAAGMMETEDKWREAVRIYQRVVEAGVPAADEARKRIQNIRLEHLIIF